MFNNQKINDEQNLLQGWDSLGERAMAIEVAEATNSETLKADLRFQAWMRKQDQRS